MDDGRQVGVAIVEDVGARGIEESSAQGVDPFGPADDRRLLAAGELGERFQGELDRLAAAAGDRHGEEVQQPTPGLVAGFLRYILPFRLYDKAGQGRRDAWAPQPGPLP